jgi:hypothetical protein
MAIKDVAKYNEPGKPSRGDRVPKLAQISARALGPVVRARLELERTLRVCGNERAPAFRFSAAHYQALVAMLREADSPLSASLRAHAAAAAGPLKIAKAAPLLRAMALDDEEDLLTRLNAAGSFLRIRGRRAAGELTALLRVKHPLVRATLYVAALNAEPALAGAAARRFKSERDARIKGYVLRRVPSLRTRSQTEAD